LPSFKLLKALITNRVRYRGIQTIPAVLPHYRAPLYC